MNFQPNLNTNKKAILLDFENTRTIRSSVIRILNIEIKELDEMLSNWRFSNELPATVEFYNFLKSNNLIKYRVDQVSWFHLTRTWDQPNLFQDGIKPLNYIIEEIWNNIRSIWLSVSESEFTDFKERHILKSHRYSNKLIHKCNHGPYAVLIKGIGKKLRNEGCHDYFSIPEIIEDIFNEIRNRYNIDLRPEYQRKTKPTIVKFFHSENAELYIGNAM